MPETALCIQKFHVETGFPEGGACVLDVDGTLLHERHGEIIIPDSVKDGLKELRKHNVKIILNTLRFPLSIIWTFGRALYDIVESPIPVVALNGSMIGELHKKAQGELEFEEYKSFPMFPEEIDRMVDSIQEFVDSGVKSVSVFYYPRAWKQGEIIWTHSPAYADELKKKYLSASSVVSTDLETLKEDMKRREVCMALFLIDLDDTPEEMMAYQHTKKDIYFTREHVDKSFGTREIAQKLGIPLRSTVGAGDTELDNFLVDVGLAIQVGRGSGQYHGRIETIKVTHPSEVGMCLKELAYLHAKNND